MSVILIFFLDFEYWRFAISIVFFKIILICSLIFFYLTVINLFYGLKLWILFQARAGAKHEGKTHLTQESIF